ncbi:MAG TPA: hypothetical protein VNN25_25640 [Thermoanaerobaculia bacterium]|nr:hypothetical protein [Thermoanaerobaculia bacterium]
MQDVLAGRTRPKTRTRRSPTRVSSTCAACNGLLVGDIKKGKYVY